MGAVHRIMERAVRKKRNYILDQANIYKNGHVKKMGPFEGFHRRAVVVVPVEEEYTRRNSKKIFSSQLKRSKNSDFLTWIRKEKKQKEGGRKITFDNEMKWKAAMSLPEEEDGLFEKIEYLDLGLCLKIRFKIFFWSCFFFV